MFLFAKGSMNACMDLVRLSSSSKVKNHCAVGRFILDRLHLPYSWTSNDQIVLLKVP